MSHPARIARIIDTAENIRERHFLSNISYILGGLGRRTSVSEMTANTLILLCRDVTGAADVEMISVGRLPGTHEQENAFAIVAVPSYIKDVISFVGYSS